MKPLLKSAPLTPEDAWIWGHVSGGFYRIHGLWLDHVYGLESDRRDADLMLHCQRNRYVPSCPWLGPLWCQVGPAGGVLSSDWYDITYCA